MRFGQSWLSSLFSNSLLVSYIYTYIHVLIYNHNIYTYCTIIWYDIGATLCKGFNRGFGTMLAASLAFLFEFIAREYGKVFRAIFIGASIFLIGNTNKQESFGICSWIWCHKYGVVKLFRFIFHRHIDYIFEIFPQNKTELWLRCYSIPVDV